jgi:Legionella pneumophila major outer membrane protein precursor
MKPYSGFRTLLMSGVAAIALTGEPVAAGSRQQPVYQYVRPGQQAPPVSYLTLEGGAACMFDDRPVISSGEQLLGLGLAGTDPPLAAQTLGGHRCGVTGRIGFGQDRVRILNVFDSWGVFGRHTEFEHQKLKAVGAAFVDPGTGYTFQNGFGGKSVTQRTVLDFEVGRNLGVGTGVRLFGGLRYARFKEKSDVGGELLFNDGYYFAGPLNAFAASQTNTFEGIGPRIGISSRARIGNGFGILLSGSASTLYGERAGKLTATHGDPGIGAAFTTTTNTAKDVWIYNFEGEAALTFQTGIPGEIVLGARVEAWHGETASSQTGRSCTANSGFDAGCTRYKATDHLNWGPFARWKIYLY